MSGNGNKSVAESLNSVVKKQIVNMADQYNIYSKAILDMEEKIKSLKQIMLSEEFLNNIKDVTLHVSDDAANNKNSVEQKFKKTGKSMDTNIAHAHTHTHAHDPAGQHAHESLDVAALKYFTPKQRDSLFWCFYIVVNTISKYDYETNYFTAEQLFKVKTIERIKGGENKKVLKDNKISKNYIESGLMNMSSSSSYITPKVLYALSLFYNVNIFYVYKNTYYEMLSASHLKKIHIIKFDTETNNYSILLHQTDNTESENNKIFEYIENIKKTYLKLDNLDNINKPLRSITTYSLTDLINIASKINISHISEVSNKNKKKIDLYTEIIQKCS